MITDHFELDELLTAELVVGAADGLYSYELARVDGHLGEKLAQGLRRLMLRVGLCVVHGCQ